MNFRVVIPARFASQRLPGKPLITLAGKPMIRHVWEKAEQSGASETIIATDDNRIAEACSAFGAEVCMTAQSHVSGTDRINEVAALRGWSDESVVVNLQGDEPLMPPANIRQVAETLHANEAADLATLCTPVRSQGEYLDPAVVKLVLDRRGRALYFSRRPVPAVRDDSESRPGCALRHLGLYAYRVAALRRLAKADACELEQAERLEQLRALWLGMVIQVDTARVVPDRGVDTEEDAAAVARILEKTDA